MKTGGVFFISLIFRKFVKIIHEDFILVEKIKEFFVVVFYLTLVIVHTHECIEYGRKFLGCENRIEMNINHKKERNMNMETANQIPAENLQPLNETKNSIISL